MKAVFVILFALFAHIQADTGPAQQPWSYDYQTQWEGVCRTGTRQSPINIMTRDAMEDKFGAHIRGPLVYSGYESVLVKGRNNDHTLSWDNRGYPSGPVLSGGPLRANYTFVEMHLHWLSEHALNGMKYALELHLVHIKEGLPLEEAFKLSDGVAVIGIMCQVSYGKGVDNALYELFQDVPALVDRGSMRNDPRTLDLRSMFSPDPQSYFTYHGSLTTPGCEEVVTWIVMERPITISDDQFNLITKVDVGSINNFRTLQPVNRVIYHVGNTPSCAAISSASTLLAALSVLLNCFSSHVNSVWRKSICILYNAKRKIVGAPLIDCAKVLN